MSAATENRAIVLLTGVAAAITGGVSMATGSYLAARTEREIFEKGYSISSAWPPRSLTWILKGILTGRPRLRSGLEFAAVALGSALVGWLVGTLFERAFGVSVP